MKKLFIAALIAVSLTSTAFAAGLPKINEKAVRNFEMDYKGAKDVQWKSSASYSKVSFMLKKEKMEAFYNQQGDLIGTSRNVDLEDLPTSAKRGFAKKYAGYTVKEAIQFDGVEGTAYYISAENETQSVILEARVGVSVFKKGNKNNSVAVLTD